MASPNYYQPNFSSNTPSPAGQFDTNQQQYGNQLVPGKDVADPTLESDEDRKKRLAAEMAASQTQPGQQPNQVPEGTGGIKPMGTYQGPQNPKLDIHQTTSSPTTPMIAPDGSVPPGIPFSPLPNPPPSLPVRREELAPHAFAANALPAPAPVAAKTAETNAFSAPPVIPPTVAPAPVEPTPVPAPAPVHVGTEPVPGASPAQVSTTPGVVPTPPGVLAPGMPTNPNGSPAIGPGSTAAAPQAGQFAPTNQGFLDWATQKFGVSPTRGAGFVDIPPGQLQSVLQQYAQATGNTANFIGGASGDQVDFGAGPQDALTSGGQIWNAAGGGGAAPSPGGGGGVVGDWGPGGTTPPAPTTPAPTSTITPPTYTPQPITSYQPLDQSQESAGLSALLSQLSGTTIPGYQGSTFDQYSAPDQTAAQGQLAQLLSQIMTQQAPGYDPSKITQYAGADNSEVSGLQTKNLKDILTNPTYSQDYINKLNESQKELITERGKSAQDSIMQDAARRGVTDSGNVGAAKQRQADTTTGELLKSNRDIELGTTGANRQALIDALTTSQGIKASDAGIATQGYGATLAGENAQAGENHNAWQSMLDSMALNNQSASTASGILTNQNNSAINNYQAGLAGQTAQAGENTNAFQQLLNAISTQNATASNTSNIMAQQAGVHNNNYNSTLAGESAAAGQVHQGYESQMAAANFGLAQNQFNATTKQFDKNFIEQIRQFDAQLAQQMVQFNLSNQQGYDLANLNSQNNLISILMGGK